jgi:hypothetical protein
MAQYNTFLHCYLVAGIKLLLMPRILMTIRLPTVDFESSYFLITVRNY